jgi:hypothetical protein
LEPAFIFQFGDWGEFQNWRIGMAPNNFVKINSLLDFISKSESNDGRLIPCVVIRLSWNKIPFVDFLDLIEPIGLKLIFHVLDSVKVRNT